MYPQEPGGGLQCTINHLSTPKHPRKGQKATTVEAEQLGTCGRGACAPQSDEQRLSGAIWTNEREPSKRASADLRLKLDRHSG